MLPNEVIERYGAPVITIRNIPNGLTRGIAPSILRWSLTVWTQGAGLQLRIVQGTSDIPPTITLTAATPLHIVFPYQGLLSTCGFDINNPGAATTICIVESFVGRGIRLDLPMSHIPAPKNTRKRYSPTPSANYFLTQRKR